MARLENGTYEEIVAHPERELELNALEESDYLPIATMASSSGKARNLLSNGIDTNKNKQCSCCKTEDHFGKTVQNTKRKKKRRPKTARSLNVQPIQNVPPAAKLITQQRNAGVVPGPKRNRQDSKNMEPSEDEDTHTKNEKSTTSTSGQSNLKKPD